MNSTGVSDHEKPELGDQELNWGQRRVKQLRSTRASRWLIVLVIVLFLLFMIIGISKILNHGAEASEHVYKAIGFGMIMVWVCIFICYFIWAVYFYNLNYGFSQKVWKKIEAAKENRSKKLDYHQKDIDQEPMNNPYRDETFGLPPGTVRGMIAFTLLFGSIAMLIVSFGMKNEIQPNSFFVDQFDFFKTAFLMMIAFYFGTHSLKYLKPNKNKNTDDSPPAQPPTPEPEVPNIVAPDISEGNPKGDGSESKEEAKG